jgi:hypothetical protein
MPVYQCSKGGEVTEEMMIMTLDKCSGCKLQEYQWCLGALQDHPDIEFKVIAF